MNSTDAEEFFTELGRRFPDQMIAVAMEQARGSLLFMLSKYGHLVLYPVHSSTMDHYRKSFYPSGAKSDPTDADLILELLRKHPDRLRPFRPDTVATRTIQFLVEARRDAVNDKTRYLNRLTSQLKMFFPQILQWFKEVDAPVVSDVLTAWPTLEHMQAAKPSALAKFFGRHRFSPERSDQLRTALVAAIPATRDQAVIATGVIVVKRLIEQLRVLRASIKEHAEKIEELTASHPDFEIFASLPGAGKVMIPRLIAALGTDRDRYMTAAELQCYSGIAPVISRSGQQCHTLIGAGRARNSCGKHSTNGHGIRPENAVGRDSTTTPSGPERNRITQRCAPSRSNGFESYFAAGRIAASTTRPGTLRP